MNTALGKIIDKNQRQAEKLLLLWNFGVAGEQVRFPGEQTTQWELLKYINIPSIQYVAFNYFQHIALLISCNPGEVHLWEFVWESNSGAGFIAWGESNKTAHPWFPAGRILRNRGRALLAVDMSNPCQFFGGTVENSMCFPSHSNIFTPLVPLIKFSLSSWIQERDARPWMLRSIFNGGEPWDRFDLGCCFHLHFCAVLLSEVWSTIYICYGNWSCHRTEPFGNNHSDHLSETGS